MLGLTLVRLLFLTVLSSTALVQLSDAGLVPPKSTHTNCVEVGYPEPQGGYSGKAFAFKESWVTGNHDKYERFFIPKSPFTPSGINFHATFKTDGSGNIDLWNEWKSQSAVYANYIYKIHFRDLKQTIAYHLNNFDGCDINTHLPNFANTPIEVTMYQL